MTHEIGDGPKDVVPAFAIVAVPRRPVVDPKQRAMFDVYLHGTGPILTHRFICHIPAAIVAGSVSVETFRFAHNTGTGSVSAVFPRQNDAMQNRFVATLNKYYFHVSGETCLLNSESQFVDPESKEAFAPISVSFKVNSKAPHGDHRVDLTFIYSSPGGSALSSSAFDLRVRSFSDRNQNLLMGILTAVAFAVPLIGPALTGSWQRLFWSIVSVTVLSLLLVMRR